MLYDKGGKTMALIKWDDSFSVNLGEIDGQHQKLIEMINDLHDAMKHGRSKDVLYKIINSLIDYAGYHFRTEEKYFDKFGYPDAKSHKEEHLHFTNKVAEFKDGFALGKIGLSMELLDFLTQWLQTHVKIVDKKYIPFFSEKGLK
jgi:hemerythrin